MLLFRGEEHIERWRSQWGQPRGGVLTIAQAWDLAQGWYGSKMSPEWRRATLDEAEALLARIGLVGEFWSLRPL
jgi:hypothetical protein